LSKSREQEEEIKFEIRKKQVQNFLPSGQGQKQLACVFFATATSSPSIHASGDARELGKISIEQEY